MTKKTEKRAYTNTKPSTLPVRFQPRFLDDTDGRCSAIRELRERLEKLKTDAAIDSYQKLLLAERAVFLTCKLETQESEAVKTGQFDGGAYVQGLNCLLGLLKSLGLNKRTKQVTNLRDYVQKKGKVERV